MAVPGEAVLITGVYGTGKSTVCEELAERLESAGVASGAIDLDWRGWIDSPQLDAAAAHRTYLANLSAVTTNYAEAGVQCLVLGGKVRSNAELDALRTVVPFPVGIVRLICRWRRSNVDSPVQSPSAARGTCPTPPGGSSTASAPHSAI